MKRIATNAQSDTEPDQLSRTAYHEAGHAVAHVGLLGEHCYDVQAFAEPRTVLDRKGRLSTVFGLCQTSLSNQPPALTIQGLDHCPELTRLAFVRAVNAAFASAAGPFAEAVLLGEDRDFDESTFPSGGEGDLESAYNALLPFYEDGQQRWYALHQIWCETWKIMLRPKVWAAVEEIASSLIALGGNAPLDGNAVHHIVDAFLPSREILWQPILRGVKWNGKINRSWLVAERAKPISPPPLAGKAFSHSGVQQHAEAS